MPSSGERTSRKISAKPDDRQRDQCRRVLHRVQEDRGPGATAVATDPSWPALVRPGAWGGDSASARTAGVRSAPGRVSPKIDAPRREVRPVDDRPRGTMLTSRPTRPTSSSAVDSEVIVTPGPATERRRSTWSTTAPV